jgi:hypothetical protein
MQICRMGMQHKLHDIIYMHTQKNNPHGNEGLPKKMNYE